MAGHAERSTSFGAIAGEYDRLRPEPPQVAIDWLLPDRAEVVVDLAAGTGLLARAVAAKARHVIAVEPDARMRAVLAARSPGVEVLPGRGEAIPLPAASADAVLVASAWHWMDPDLTVPEISRVLRDAGRFGIVWTGRDRAAPWLHADDWFREAHAETDEPGEEAEPARGDHRDLGLLDPETFRGIETRLFRFARRMSSADLVDWLTTYSRVIMASAAARDAGRARAAAALADQFPGATEIDVPMRALCWRAVRVPRPPD